MFSTAPSQTQAAIDGILADLAATTDQLQSVIRRDTAGEGGPGLPVAGDILRVTSRLTAAAVDVLGSVTHRGVIADEGLTIGSWLRSFAGCTYADERMLDNTAGRLVDMPTLSRWFSDGAVSWATVRGVVYAVRNLTKAQRRWVDATLAEDADRVGRLGPDELVVAVEGLVNQARPDLHRDREQRSFEHEFLRLQLGLDADRSPREPGIHPDPGAHARTCARRLRLARWPTGWMVTADDRARRGCVPRCCGAGRPAGC